MGVTRRRLEQAQQHPSPVLAAHVPCRAEPDKPRLLYQLRQVYDVHEKNLGYDVTSLDSSSGELRVIEVKGLPAATGAILLTPNERRVAEDRRDWYWLYAVTHSATEPTF